jgi:hypothetical protein
MFPATFSELLEVVMPLIQTEKMIIRDCYLTSQTRPYTVSMFVQQPLLHNLLDHAWATPYKNQP